MDHEVNERLAAAAPVEVLPREDLIRECLRLRRENENWRETLHALMCKASDVVNCFKKVGGTGSLYLEASGVQAEQALLELRELVERSERRQ